MGGFLHKLNKPKTLVVVLALTLVVDSFLLYRYRLIEPRRAPRRSTGLDRIDNRPLGEHGAPEHNTAFAPDRKNGLPRLSLDKRSAWTAVSWPSASRTRTNARASSRLGARTCPAVRNR